MSSWRSCIPALAAVGIGLTLAPHAAAQQRAGSIKRLHAPARAPKTPIEAFRTLSPTEQQKVLNGLPAGKRQKLEQRLQKFDQLPAEQQETLRNLYNRLHELPPERQDAVRKAVDRFSKQPPVRQQAIRDELRTMMDLSEEDRQARLKSPDFRANFSRREQGIVRDMSPLLAPE